MLFGLGAIIAIMGLCLVQRELQSGPEWRGIILWRCRPWVPVHSAAALSAGDRDVLFGALGGPVRLLIVLCLPVSRSYGNHGL